VGRWVGALIDGQPRIAARALGVGKLICELVERLIGGNRLGRYPKSGSGGRRNALHHAAEALDPPGPRTCHELLCIAEHRVENGALRSRLDSMLGDILERLGARAALRGE